MPSRAHYTQRETAHYKRRLSYRFFLCHGTITALRSHSCTKASRSSPTSDFMASLQREIFLRLK